MESEGRLGAAAVWTAEFSPSAVSYFVFLFPAGRLLSHMEGLLAETHPGEARGKSLRANLPKLVKFLPNKP